MSKLMQLPSLYIRGSLGTQTMANMTSDQILETERIVKEVASDQSFAPDKYNFIKQLGATIRADYYSDRKVAEQEFVIAIWRATVHLLFHRDYEYICSLCGHTEYRTQGGKMKSLDRQYKVCPQCNRTRLESGQVARVVKKQKRFYLVNDDNDVIGKSFSKRVALEKTVISPVNTIMGAKKIEDPYVVLNDPEQRNKWYTTWIWNYFRQILNENVIRTHNKQQVETSGPANIIAFQLVLNELNKYKYKYYYDESTLRSSNIHTALEVFFSFPATDPSFTYNFLIPLIYEYQNLNVMITASNSSVKIETNGEPPIVNAIITTIDQVIMLSTEKPRGNDNFDDGSGWRDSLEYNARDFVPDNSIEQIESNDIMNLIRDQLDDISKDVFDIFSQSGEVWSRFSNEWGTRQACKSHIAKFMSISTKRVDEIKNEIAERCIDYGLNE